MFEWLLGKPQKSSQELHRERVEQLPQCWQVGRMYEEDGLREPWIDGGSNGHPLRVDITDKENNYGTIHYTWEPKHKYDCGGWSSSQELDDVYLSEAEAQAAYEKYMVEYAERLVKMGFDLLCKYKKG